MVTPEAVLTFWFGEEQPLASTDTNRPLWFKKDSEFDAVIRDRFQAALDQALAGAFDSWVDSSPLHALALVVMLDQFARNIYRGSGQSFAYDAKAVSVAQQVIAKGWDRQLAYPGRTFIYLVLVHSEDISVQREVLRLSEALAAEAEDAFKPQAQRYLSSVKKHFDIVERFGRYPHRNELLGRESTPEEIEFLKSNPGF